MSAPCLHCEGWGCARCGAPINRTLSLPHSVEVTEQRVFMSATSTEVCRSEPVYQVRVRDERLRLTAAQFDGLASAWRTLRGES